MGFDDLVSVLDPFSTKSRFRCGYLVTLFGRRRRKGGGGGVERRSAQTRKCASVDNAQSAANCPRPAQLRNANLNCLVFR